MLASTSSSHCSIMVSLASMTKVGSSTMIFARRAIFCAQSTWLSLCVAGYGCKASNNFATDAGCT
jgi:hypothetical protein